MTTISVTFVICINEYQTKVSGKKKKGKLAKKDSIEEESTISLDFKEVKETPFETSETNTINVQKPVKSLQINYEIIPKLIYTVDVLFWGPVAKIITKDKIKSVSTITKLKNRWITFTIDHKFVLEINELLLYKSHSITLNMRLEKSGTLPNVTVPDSSTFFFINEDIDLNCIFAEVFEYIPNSVDEQLQAEEDVKLILQEILYFAFKGEILNLLKVPDINYRKKILNMINSFIGKKHYECFNMNVNEGVNVLKLLETKSTRSKKEDKKKNKQKNKLSAQENNTFQLIIPAQVLFTDPNMTAFNFEKSTADMKCAFVIVNANNLINTNQKSILYPVVIKLNKLINIPVEHLSKERFEYLYLTYNICGFTCSTLAKEIRHKIHFKNHQIFFLEKKIKAFSQMSQNDYLIVQIHGIRKCLITRKSEIFGTNRQDKFLSVPMRNKIEIKKYSTESSYKAINESVLVAVACFKLNLLFSTFRSFSQLEYCIHPSRCPVTLIKTMTAEVSSTFTVNAINTHTKETKLYPLSEDALLDSELSLTVKMEIHKSINKILNDMIQQEIFFNRIILITGHGELAKYILSNVFRHNSCWIYKDDIMPPNYMSGNESNIDINNVNIISGFSIDNGDMYIMYLEGNSKWVKNVLWRHIRSEYVHCTKILYNSDHVYRERVYMNLIPLGGVYNISLHSSLKALLDCSKIFSPGYVPEPSRRAFKKIDMILKCKFLNEITIDMLPTKKELLSLDIEWGVPIHWPLTEDEE